MKKILHLLVLPVIACLVILAGPNKVKADSTTWFIRSATTYRSPISNPITSSDIMSTLRINNWNGDSPSSVMLDLSAYTGNENVPGTYTVFALVNGTDTLHLSVIVYDNIKPTITVPDCFIKSPDKDLSLSAISNKVTYSDNITSNADIKLVAAEDTYTGHADEVGTYWISFYAVDSASNTSDIKKTKVIVTNNLPEVYIYDDTVYVNQSVELTRQMMVNVLSGMGAIDTTKDLTLTWNNDTYTSRTRVEASLIPNNGLDYVMNLTVSYRDGNYENFDLTIHVSNDALSTKYAGNNWHNRWINFKASVKKAFTWFGDTIKDLWNKVFVKEG